MIQSTIFVEAILRTGARSNKSQKRNEAGCQPAPIDQLHPSDLKVPSGSRGM